MKMPSLIDAIGNKKNIRQGFTLVELLIAIVIVGILSGVLLLSGTSATSSARAVTIIQSFQTLKQAALMLQADSGDVVGTMDADDLRTAISQYLEKPLDSKYTFTSISDSWYAVYDLTGTPSELRARLASRAQSAGLLSPSGGAYTASEEKVLMRIW